MQLTSVILEQLDREAELTRRALERVPKGKNDWKPHPKSMPLGQLAHMVATMPSWISMIVKQDELDVAPKEGRPERPQPKNSKEYLAALDDAAAQAREALQSSSESHLQTEWKLLAAGQVVFNGPRQEMLRDTMNHWAHHRGQMTVYLRLMGSKVPALYGPSADDQQFR